MSAALLYFKARSWSEDLFHEEQLIVITPEMESNNREDENCVEYRIFPVIESTDEGSVFDVLSNLLNNILAEIGHLVINFIWQKDRFGLRCVTSQTGVNGK